MSDPKNIAQQFLDAVIANDAARWETILTDDAGLRVATLRDGAVYRPRARVIKRLMDEASAWRDATVQLQSILIEDHRVAIQFRIQVTEHARYIEHNRAVFLALKDERVQMIDLYAPAPQPSARRDKTWVAPATLSDDELNRLFASLQYTFDVYEWIPPNITGTRGLSESRWSSEDAHPGSNGIADTQWTAEDADAKILAVIEEHRARNVGFTWFVSAYDTPADLRARLERHGLVLAGDQAFMARVGLDNLDIPINPAVSVELIDGTDDAVIEACLQIIGRCFNWTPAQIDERRPGFYERNKNPKFRDEEIHYLARLDGVPVADARAILRGGIAYLGGASTLPEYRNRKIYSTMLR
ncbi:MAG: hypothetical protein HZC40_15670, partial [Chloroflexi bacterium]|nr:hypothetical protein [Chloroflexota bacterium]